MIRGAFVAALLLGALQPAAPQRLWLVIAASDASAAGIAAKARTLADVAPNGLVVQTSDCGEQRNAFAWVVDVSTNAAAAQEAVAKVRGTVKDAYVKRCDVKPGSLLAFRVSAVDRSIADVPKTAVNWSEQDMVSSVLPLAGRRGVVIDRYYADAPEDPLEGRRERVVLADTSGKRLTLEENCTRMNGLAAEGDRLAFQCVTGQAADNLLHKTVAFKSDGTKIADVERCRDPRWSGGAVVCQAESVGPDGQLKLVPKRTDVQGKRPPK